MMAVLPPHHRHPMNYRPQKRRRTATAVMAGYFDERPQRCVLTSLLNGVPPNKEVEGEEEARKAKKKKDTKKDIRQDASARRDSFVDLTTTSAPPVASSSSDPLPPPAQQPKKKASNFWVAKPARPNIQLMPMERSLSVTPPPGYSPVDLTSDPPTPGPSMSVSTSRTSSKRPRTPDDFQDLVELESRAGSPPPEKKPRKKRIAHKKGWKGWIEGELAPSEKLINLDSVPVLQERRTRSGKNFDAISVGKESWV